MTSDLAAVLEGTIDAMARHRAAYRVRPAVRETGVVEWIREGVAGIRGLPRAALGEVLRFPGGRLGFVLVLTPDEVGAVLLDQPTGLEAGDEVHATHRALDVPVGEAVLGRIVDPAGRAIDDGPTIIERERWPIHRPAPTIMARAPVSRPLQTGIRVVDALVPIGRGQRELIVGDRETGKTALALDMMISQRTRDVLCIYCAVGRRRSAVAHVAARLRAQGMMEQSIVMVAAGEDPPGMQFVAPYAAMTMAEYFMMRGRDVLIAFDDLTGHARAYRELSLLLLQTPGREAYPGDIFHVQAQLLERATQLASHEGGGSITALPIVETQAQNLAAYIPTNIISITDGQLYLSPTHFQKGVMPAVDVGRSVSRVGDAAQPLAYRAITSGLRLGYAQFHELEQFARFAPQLDEETRRQLRHGRRLREVLKQPEGDVMPVEEQLGILVPAVAGVLDTIPLDLIATAVARLRTLLRESLPTLVECLHRDEPLTESDRRSIIEAARECVRDLAFDEASAARDATEA